ncbi:MAG: response regulator [Anaerolineales bacterium]|nr:response regulator [Anaerolineales bacterium]
MLFSLRPVSTILVVEEDEVTLQLVRVNLERASLRVIATRTGADGIQSARHLPPDLVICNASLPDMDGVQFCRMMLDDNRTRPVPIMLMADQAQPRQIVEALEIGADDYLCKPFDYAELVARAKAHIRRAQLKPAINPLSGLPGNLIIEQEIRRLTGPNAAPFAVLYIDLNNFKSYNDVYGFPAGDEVLRLLANVITSAVTELGNPNDLVGHVGGDDFVSLSTPDRADAVAQRIIADFDRQVPELYTPLDRRRGYITAKDRQGIIRKFPLVGVVIAIVHNEHRPITSHWEVGEIGAELKSFAKTRGGSSYVRDKRRA